MEPTAAGATAATAVESTSTAITESSSSAVSITGAMGSDWQGDGYTGAVSAMNTLSRAHTTTASNVDSLAQAITTALNDVQTARAAVLNLVGQATGAGMLVTPSWQVIPVIPTAATTILAQLFQVAIAAAVADLEAADRAGAQAITAAAQTATSSSSGNPYIKNVFLPAVPLVIAGAEAAGGLGLGGSLAAGLGLGGLGLLLAGDAPHSDAPLLGTSRSPMTIDQDKKRDGDPFATGLDTDGDRVECRDDNSVYISYKDMPEYAQHVLDAQANGHPSVLHPDHNKKANRARRRAAIEEPQNAAGNKAYPARGDLGRLPDDQITGFSDDVLSQEYKDQILQSKHSGQSMPSIDRDEYPPAGFIEGGHGADVRYIDGSQNRAAGQKIDAQLNQKGISDYQDTCVVVVPQSLTSK